MIFNIAVTKCKAIWPQNHGGSDIENAAKWIFCQVAQGMQYLHDELNIVHRDLKHENILMGLKSPDPYNEDERQPMVKVADFTTAFVMPADNAEFKIQTKAGTLAFNAPEQFTEPEYYPKPLDVWSYGICLYVYLTNCLPYKSHIEGDLESEIVGLDAEKLVASNLAEFSAPLKELVLLLLNRDPMKRPSFAFILGHSWFSGKVEEKLSTENDYKLIE